MQRIESAKLGPVFSFAAVVAFLLGCLTPVGANADTDDRSPACVGADVPSTVGRMHGTLCQPLHNEAKTVIVLVPGAYYNHTYWDFPYQPDTYNFRLAMNRAGYATFVVDRFGTGASSRPPSSEATATANASAVHVAIQQLRSGQIGGTRFSSVVLGGHSLGSAIAVIEATRYNDEDGVMLTGFDHHVDVSGPPCGPGGGYYPADQDPKFAGRGYDYGYSSSRLGGQVCNYGAGFYDPEVVAVDYQGRDVTSRGEARDGFAVFFNVPPSSLIKHPVMIAIGSQDRVLCTHDYCFSSGALVANEAAYFSPAACLEAYVLNGSGHSINLATNTEDYQEAMLDWLHRLTIGKGLEAEERDMAGRCPSRGEGNGQL